MIFEAAFSGSDQPFEGERTILVKGLPEGARVLSARVTLTPVAAPGRPLFEEVLTFSGDLEPYGATKVPRNDSVEVAFHTRRTLQAVRGVHLVGARLLVDLGAGVFMRVTDEGALATPDDSDAELFDLKANHLLPGLTVAGFRLFDPTPPAPPAVLDVTQITVRSVPTHVSLAIDDQPPFWTHTGEMTTPQAGRDFAEFLQAYLDEEAAVVDGYYHVPLVVHSDLLARLDARVELEYQQEQSGLPEGVGEAALTYAHDGSAQAEAELLTVALPAGAVVTAASVQVVGAFDDSRILVGPVGPVEPAAAVPVTAGISQAQPVLLDTAAPATAVDLLLSSLTETAVIDFNVQGDVDGRPFGESLLPAPVTIELTRELAAEPTWLSARLPDEFQFLPGVRYWLTFQVRSGEVIWLADAAEAGALGMFQTTNDGLSWRATRQENVEGPLAGYYRLRHVPERYTMPLEVWVGRGEGVERVSLERFAPLNRIDFTIDFPEFAEAINRAARREESAGCPAGEQLGNPDFERWRLVDREIGEPEPVVAGSLSPFASASAVAASPNGRWVFAGLDERSVFLAVPEHGVLGAVGFNPASARVLAVGPQGRRVYLAGPGGELHVLDGETFQPVGDPLEIGPAARALALSPDGRQLFLGLMDYEMGGLIAVVDTTVLEGLLSGPGGASLEDALAPGTAAAPNPIELEEAFVPAALAVSPDGGRLIAALQDPDGRGVAAVYDARALAPLLDEPIPLGSSPSDVAVSPDGSLALVANAGDDSLSLIDLARLRLDQTLRLPNPRDVLLEPAAAAFDPAGGRAFIATRGSQAVYVLDLADRSLGEPIRLGAPGRGVIDLAVTPMGDRLYAALGEPLYGDPDSAISGLVYLPLGRQVPEEWDLTTGFVLPIDYTGPNHLAAVLGPMIRSEREARPARPSSLSQVAPAAGGCAYTFEFWGITDDFQEEAAAEVIWRGAACAVERTDRVPIQALEIQAEVRPREVERLALTRAQTVRSELPELRLHRVQLEAPPGAQQAEVRFLVPPEKHAVIDTVSLQSSGDPLANGDLQFVQDDALVGWNLAPPEAQPPTLVVAEDEVQIANHSQASVSLFQSFPVTAAQPFTLELHGRVVSQLGPDAPGLELRWLASGGTAGGDPTLLAAAPGETEHRLSGTVPAGAAEAELHLVIPSGATLGVGRVSFLPVELVSVPVQFIAQAPGELTVEDFRVSYEAGEPSRPPVPESGPCPPAPPVVGHEGKGGGCKWCPSPCGPCAGEPEGGPSAPGPVEAQPPGPIETLPRGPVVVAQPAGARPVRAVTPRRRAAVIVRRPESALLRAAPAERPALRAMEADVEAALPAEEAGWARLAGELAVAALPLEAIDGIAAGRARDLRRMNVATIPQLAAAGRDRIARIEGVSPGMAERFIAQAQELLAAPEKLPAPLVSCLMPTADRRAFVPQAVEYFLRQDYPRRELIVLDDGGDPVADLIPDDERVRYLRLEGRQSIGAKRNRGARESRGVLLANWDDDVWYAPWRLSYQVAALLARGAGLVGIENLLHYDPFSQQAWHAHRPPGSRPWMPGSTFLYRKSFWEARTYPNTQPGGDIQFLRSAREEGIVALQAENWMVDIVHGLNTSPKDGGNPRWVPIPVDEIRELMGDDWAFYQELAALP